MQPSSKVPSPSSESTDKNTSSSRSPTLPLSPIVLKDTRRWDHDTRHFKKRVDFVKLKESKGQANYTRYWDFKPRYLSWAGSAEYDEHLACKEAKADWKDIPHSLRRRPRSPEQDEATAERMWKQSVPSLQPEISLADLLTPRKPRHRREPDFEVVPSVRSVIVLDESTAPEVDVDEPWEHVYAEDDGADGHPNKRDRPQLSYAKIAALK